MPEQSMPTLETARLVLRPFDTGDIESLTDFIFADPEVTRYLPRTQRAPRERAERMIAHHHSHWHEHGFGVWAVTAKVDRSFIGYCGLNFLPEVDEVEIDYGLRQAHWGQGFATEAAHAGIRFGFAEASLTRLIGLVVPENLASRRVLEHLGMVYVREVRLWGLDLQWHEARRD